MSHHAWQQLKNSLDRMRDIVERNKFYYLSHHELLDIMVRCRRIMKSHVGDKLDARTVHVIRAELMMLLDSRDVSQRIKPWRARQFIDRIILPEILDEDLLSCMLMVSER